MTETEFYKIIEMKFLKIELLEGKDLPGISIIGE